MGSATIAEVENPTRVIHTSDRILFKRCRQQWDFASPLRMNLEPIPNAPSALWFGTGIHKGLEILYIHNLQTALDEWFKYCNEAEFDVEQTGKHSYELGVGMLTYYDRWRVKYDEGLRWIGHEVERKMPIRTIDQEGVAYGYRLDGLIEDQNNRFWIGEFKTVASFDSNYDYLLNDEQTGSYDYYESLFRGIKIEGTYHRILRKENPKPLRVLAKGDLSADKDQLTTYEIAREQIIQHYITDGFGAVPEKLKDLLRYLKDKRDSFVHQEIVRRSRSEIAMTELSIGMEAAQMLDPDVPIYRSNSKFNCNGCFFFYPCLRKWEGGDYQQLLNLEYRLRKDNEGNAKV